MSQIFGWRRGRGYGDSFRKLWKLISQIIYTIIFRLFQILERKRKGGRGFENTFRKLWNSISVSNIWLKEGKGWRFISKIMKTSQSNNIHDHFPGCFKHWSVNGGRDWLIFMKNDKCNIQIACLIILHASFCKISFEKWCLQHSKECPITHRYIFY